MPVFVVIVTRESAAVAEKIRQLPDTPSYEIKSDTWVVNYNGTTRELAEKIGIRQAASTSSGVAFSIANFSGKHRPDLWEWLTLHSKGDGE